MKVFVSKKTNLKISKEARIGLIGFVIFGTILFVFNYLNRQNVFSRNLIITAEFEDVNYIKKGDPVLIKGREYGTVVAIYKDPKGDGERLFVDLDIEPGTKIPKTATAMISELSIMGGRAVSIVYERVCDENCLETGDIIPGMISTMQRQVAEGAEPILKMIGNFADTISGPNGMDRMMEKAYQSLNGLKKTTNKTNSQLRGLQRSLPADVKSFKQLTAALIGATTNNTGTMAQNMTSNREMAMALDTLFQNLSQLSQADMDSMTQLLYTAYETAEKVPEQLKRFQAKVDQADLTIDSLELSLAPYQRGQKGIVPKLLYDEAFKDSTQQSVKDLSEQVKDIRENPGKYLSL